MKRISLIIATCLILSMCDNPPRPYKNYGAKGYMYVYPKEHKERMEQQMKQQPQWIRDNEARPKGM